MSTNFPNFCDFHKLLSQFTKNNTSEISQNSQFSKISTQKKIKFSKITQKRKKNLNKRLKGFQAKIKGLHCTKNERFYQEFLQ